MAVKKIPIGLNPAEAELEHRVEVMMEPVKIPIVDHTEVMADPASTGKAATKTANKITVVDHADSASSAPIDIFSDPKTAPAVPNDLLAKLTASTKAKEPVETTETTIVTPPAALVAVPKPELPPAPVVINRVPQLIASTAPKLPSKVSENYDNEALLTPDAAPEFIKESSVETGAEISGLPKTQLDDAKTESALAAITASEADELLAAQDALRDQSASTAPKPNVKSQKQGRKLWLLPIILLLLLLAVVVAVPYSRYKLAGLVVSKPIEVQVLDSKTGRPVSQAKIQADNQTVESNSQGIAHFKTPVGKHNISVDKQYYVSSSVSAFTGFKAAKPITIQLVASGRQVPVQIMNALTGKPVSGAEIKISRTNAKTDAQGKAVIVLPADQKTLTGTINAASYNDSSVTVQITDTAVVANSFKLVPSGSVYVLSNASGTIDIVKTNLDGSKPTTVVKGTGKEDTNSTVLLAARDWKYVVLKAQRDSSQAAMYLLDTSTDKLVEFDSGDANFTPIGWYGHTFMYDAVRNSVATSQNAHELLKSYDAERGQLNQLDSSQAATAPTGFTYQGFYNFNLVDNLLVYNTQWYSSGGADVSSKNATIRAVQTNGQGKKDYQTIPAAGLAYIQAAQPIPGAVYYATFNYSDNKNQYYAFQNQIVSSPASVTAASFNKTFPAYAASPSGKQTAWTDTRDGKKVVVVGDSAGANSHVVNSLNGFNVYGWYGDDYLLVSKNNSQLFIVPSGGLIAPVALTNYFKPGQNVAVYSYGYGGF